MNAAAVIDMKALDKFAEKFSPRLQTRVLMVPVHMTLNPFSGLSSVWISHIVTDGDIFIRGNLEFFEALGGDDLLLRGAGWFVAVGKNGLIESISVGDDFENLLEFLEEYNPVLEERLFAQKHYLLEYPYDRTDDRYADVT